MTTSPAPTSHVVLPPVAWAAAEGGALLRVEAAWSTLTGQSAEESRGFGWLEAVHPEDRRKTTEAWTSGGTNIVSVDHRILSEADGRYHHYRSCAVRKAGATGEWSGASIPVEDLLNRLEQQRGALEALRHRARNTLGIIRSIIRRTIRAGGSAEDYAAEIDARLGALTRVHAALIRDPLAGLDLAQMLADELSAWTLKEEGQVTIQGCPVRLRGKMAESLGLMIHELLADMVKRGGFSAPRSHLRVAWNVAEAGESARLVINWEETASSPVPAASERMDFAREMLERTLPYELGAKTGRQALPDGQRIVIELPQGADVIVDQAGQPQSRQP
ncbi:HWE histidine kinase domain-containing protein [Roseomonas elaeocarpi]|uniref:histidine kinase n=1 Tax=Roseomonas elaeocarpi TaxID=907779 RepID=A0ABV6JSX3_9PROT